MNTPLTVTDLHRIEREARRLRAEAFRDMLAALVRWASGRLAGRAARRPA
jgi:hypothetical protein